MKTIRFYGMMLMTVMLAFCMASCGDDDDEDDGGGTTATIPTKYRTILSPYITIYDGENPPMLDGTFLMSPDELVYTSDGAKEPGAILSDYYVKFSKMNSSKGTIVYQGKTKNGSADAGISASITGNGNNFTVFFTTTSSYKGATDKRFTIFSGTLTAKGIQNLHWAWIVTDKTNDPNNYLPEEGVYRIFKDGDGMAENAVWPE